MEKFLAALKYGKDLFERPSLGNGYLIKLKQEGDGEEEKKVHHMTEEEKIKILTTKIVIPYIEFSPILFKEYQENPDYLIDEFDDFDEAVAIYFDNLRRNDIVEKVDMEKEVWKKFENIKKDQQGRLDKITVVKDKSFKMA